MTRLALLVLLTCPPLIVAAPPAVVELFEDDADALIPQLTMGGISGSEDVKASVETDDIFTGKVALRIAPSQRFGREIKNWDYPIAEKPKEGEYRYLRFAWKKAGEGPIMLQFHTRRPTADWVIRFYMGPNAPPWTSKVLSQTPPTDWQVVTCDMFKDFGAVSVGGIAFTPLDSSDGLFDHILLGRTIDDLDRATAAAILKRPPRAVGSAQLQKCWADLSSGDDVIASTATWSLVAGRKDAVPFLLKNVVVPHWKEPPAVDESEVQSLIGGLTHYRHVTREAAFDDLSHLGEGSIPHLRKAIAAAEGPSKDRLMSALDRLSARSGLDTARLRRCVTILRAINAPETRELLGMIEKALPPADR